MKDLEEKLAILQRKRAEDKARIKELERAKLQLQQVSKPSPLIPHHYNLLDDRIQATLGGISGGATAATKGYQERS